MQSKLSEPEPKTPERTPTPVFPDGKNNPEENHYCNFCEADGHPTAYCEDFLYLHEDNLVTDKNILAQTIPGAPPRDEYQVYYRCQICGRLGHQAEYCPQAKRHHFGTPLHCSRCNKWGHNALDCSHPRWDKGAKPTFYCTKCRQIGHELAYCRLHAVTARCYKCGQEGHYPQQCRSLCLSCRKRNHFPISCTENDAIPQQVRVDTEIKRGEHDSSWPAIQPRNKADEERELHEYVSNLSTRPPPWVPTEGKKRNPYAFRRPISPVPDPITNERRQPLVIVDGGPKGFHLEPLSIPGTILTGSFMEEDDTIAQRHKMEAQREEREEEEKREEWGKRYRHLFKEEKDRERKFQEYYRLQQTLERKEPEKCKAPKEPQETKEEEDKARKINIARYLEAGGTHKQAKLYEMAKIEEKLSYWDTSNEPEKKYQVDPADDDETAKRKFGKYFRETMPTEEELAKKERERRDPADYLDPSKYALFTFYENKIRKERNIEKLATGPTTLPFKEGEGDPVRISHNPPLVISPNLACSPELVRRLVALNIYGDMGPNHHTQIQINPDAPDINDDPSRETYV